MAALAAASFGYLATNALRAPENLRDTLGPRRSCTLYTIAAMLVPAIVPYTLTLMRNVNGRLHAKADAYRSSTQDSEVRTHVDDREVRYLIKKWQWLNAGRAVLAGTGALAGVWAIVSRPEPF